jgi:hypothetical protein
MFLLYRVVGHRPPRFARSGANRKGSCVTSRLPTRGIYYAPAEIESTQERTTVNLKSSHRQSARRLEFLGTLMDSYMNWRDHSRAVNESYRRWADSTASDRGIAYDRYLAVLDREEHAAHGYKHALDPAQAT